MHLARQGRSSEQGDAGETDQHAQPRAGPNPVGVGDAKQHHPNGSMAMISAARPEGNVSLGKHDQAVTAEQQGQSDERRADSSRRPMRRLRQPRSIAMTSAITRPATTNLAPAASSGGIVLTTTAMARYVEPQTT